MRPNYDLDEIVDGRPVGGSMVVFLLVMIFALISDGFDIAAMGYIAPELIKAWGAKPADLVPAFSSGIIGLMVGGPLLGFLGDRFGRRRTIVWGLTAIGVTTLATAAASSVTHFIVLRFLTGIALGGVIPNVAALVAEGTPRRIRGRLLVSVTMGMPLGIALPGLVSAVLVPSFGWPSILVVGGLLPIAVAMATQLLVPESLKFLAAQPGRDAEAQAAARRMRPDLGLPEDFGFAVASAYNGGRQSPRLIFSGSLLFVTPLLWLCQATNQMANFFSLTWLPMLLQAGGATTGEAGANAALFALGGFAAGFVLLMIIDRLGIIPLVLLFFVGAPLVAMMASPDLSPWMHAIVIAGAGACVTGINFGLVALLSIIYPTGVRSMGTGWTHAAGRVGALAAPIVGGLLLQMQIPARDLTLAPAILLAVGGICCATLAVIFVRRFGGTRLGEFAIGPAAPVAAGAGKVG